MDFGQTCTFVALRDHACQIVVDGTGENIAQHDPQERGCAELRAHDGTDDGTDACDVQELNQENPPGLHRHIVDAVSHGGGWGGALRVYAEDLLDELPI